MPYYKTLMRQRRKIEEHCANAPTMGGTPHQISPKFPTWNPPWKIFANARLNCNDVYS